MRTWVITEDQPEGREEYLKVLLTRNDLCPQKDKVVVLLFGTELKSEVLKDLCNMMRGSGKTEKAH